MYTAAALAVQVGRSLNREASLGFLHVIRLCGGKIDLLRALRTSIPTAS